MLRIKCAVWKCFKLFKGHEIVLNVERVLTVNSICGTLHAFLHSMTGLFDQQLLCTFLYT